MNNIFRLIMCHMLGDYVLQNDFLAKTKGNNFYHLVVHSTLYCFPFYIFYGFNTNLIILLVSHILVDIGKAKYNAITYFQDQLLHYFIIFILYILF